MDLLSALHSFVRVAATGSFSAVSRETGASQPTISRHIALLEQHYGTTLFARTTRSLMMTEDGRSLLPHAYEVIEILETVETELGRRRASVSGLVRIGVTTAFGLYVASRLGELLERHPDLSIELVVRDGFGDLVEDGLDLAVRIGEIAEGSLIVRRLGSIQRKVIASRAYIARRGRPEHPRDLVTHPCIAHTYSGLRFDLLLERDGEQSAITASGPFRANNTEAVLTAVRAGAGIGVLPSFQVQDGLDSGEFVELFNDWSMPLLPFYAVHTGPRTLPLRTRAVLDFLVEISSVLRHHAD
ncbi:LysR family transcriptional regulator [Ameyamaea chiangmaiensis NBRC 103196]|uniref:LysR family transcriptional regulator n=1 Tax=Ameyamaea chiangmaiensis TaxID=442969 RepID=A0A850P9X3_9PROT|nr:LysR family transcriptional regulator [Ameyamaea chiangmaiensis]MBS4073963.1 LysR family transcriptional regulator [Ameyamaea chiangmaiensis]NVN40834.1 LysR family transcriptional regulator [Ameyamaea chiangmaiensis]GBQ67789.1 LysR family transcriptional regulator [Ameyamaea chiangmaiensis NBRC 103196]